MSLHPQLRTPLASTLPLTVSASELRTPPDRLPLSGLLALATAAFITILTEALPAGLLPQMSAGLGVSESMVGQLVTLYVIGSFSTAILLIALTRRWRRRPLLLAAIGGFAIVNTVTAMSTSLPVILAARFVAGVFAGLLWGLLAGYASRMVAPHLRGRAIAVAMAGTPFALSLGLPLATLVGQAVGWRSTFGIMTAMTVALFVWARLSLPDFKGEAASSQLPITRVFALPGIKAVLSVTLFFVLAHNVLYTYIAPLIAPAGLTGHIDTVLLTFGAAAVAGIWGVGVLIDRHLRRLVLASAALFAVAAVVLGMAGHAPVAVYVAMAGWGLAFGGAATLFQTASASTAGAASDLAQSMIVTVWNVGIAGGGLFGGLLLDTAGVALLPWVVAALSVLTLVIAWRARAHGFPSAAPHKTN